MKQYSEKQKTNRQYIRTIIIFQLSKSVMSRKKKIANTNDRIQTNEYKKI